MVAQVEVLTYWIFPYFLSKHVAEVAPHLKMCHFVVEYDNHPVFKKGNSTRSPVRLVGEERSCLNFYNPLSGLGPSNELTSSQDFH